MKVRNILTGSTAITSVCTAIVGRAVSIHAKPNDPSQPPIGAAGARQAWA